MHIPMFPSPADAIAVTPGPGTAAVESHLAREDLSA
jgi:hypothetical protein